MSSLEYISAACNVAYVLLIGKKSPWGWIFGIVGAALGTYLLYSAKLYFDTFLYGSYVFMCGWGLFLWLRSKAPSSELESEKTLPVHRMRLRPLVSFSIVCVVLSLALGYVAQTYTDASYAYADAITTVFGLGFTWMQGKRYIENWPGFLVINFLSALLYWLKGLEVYTLQMLLFNALAIWAWRAWYKSGVTP